MVLGRRHPPKNNKQLLLKQQEEAAVSSSFHFRGTMFEQEEEEEEEQEGLLSSSVAVDHHNSNHNNPKKKKQPSDRISDWEAGASLAKAIMGAGSFALPWAFSVMGYIMGPLFLCVLLGMSVYSMNLLVTCARGTSTTTTCTSYVDVARATFGTTGARLAYVASVSASIGVCGSYLVFIAANLQSLVVHPSEWMTQGSWILLVLPLAVLLSSVRDMKQFAFASLLGDVSVVLGMGVVLVYGLLYRTEPMGHDCVAVGSLETMPLAFGAIGYLFLVHFLVLPIESAMAHPEHFHSVTVVTFAVCAVLSGTFGVIGYLLFGQDTQQIVLLNVQGSFFVSAVKLLLCVDLLLTYPVVMRPSIVILEQSCLNSTTTSTPSSTLKKPQRRPSVVGWSTHMAVCTILGLVAAGSSIYVPAFGLLSGLVGGVSQTFLALVLPPLMLSQQQHPKGVFGISGKEIVLVLVGLVLIVWTLISTWKELS
jgi:proton-coupled amino acid transporter